MAPEGWVYTGRSARRFVAGAAGRDCATSDAADPVAPRTLDALPSSCRAGTRAATVDVRALTAKRSARECRSAVVIVALQLFEPQPPLAGHALKLAGT
jgi:hypothetical protein